MATRKCDVWMPAGNHDWRLARLEEQYEDGAWEKVTNAVVSKPLPIGTMGLFYCRKCLQWTTSDIPSDLPGFGA